jgi:hypothetical protein
VIFLMKALIHQVDIYACAVHAACAHVAHISGAVQQHDQILDDIEDHGDGRQRQHSGPSYFTPATDLNTSHIIDSPDMKCKPQSPIRAAETLTGVPPIHLHIKKLMEWSHVCTHTLQASHAFHRLVNRDHKFSVKTLKGQIRGDLKSPVTEA